MHSLGPWSDLARAGAPEPPSPSTTNALLELPDDARLLCTAALAVMRGALRPCELQIAASPRRPGPAVPRAHFIKPQSTSS